MKETTNTEKEELRQIMRRKRQTILPEEKMQQDKQLQHTLLQSGLLEKSPCLLCYAALPQEPQTMLLLEIVRSMHITAALPVCLPGKRLLFRVLRSDSALLNQLIAGKYGIPEPDEQCVPLAHPPAGAICLVPGLAFDRIGGRLGYGAGYYDRFLAENPQVMPLGMAPLRSLVARVPMDENDCRMHGIITEEKVEIWHGTE